MRRFIFLFVALFMTVLVTHPAQAEEPRPFKQNSFEAILTRHKGRPLIVSFWSLTCQPCIAEMPLWRDALAAYPELSLVLVSTDSPEEGERIQRILDRHGLSDVDSWVFADPFVERLRYGVDRKWQGEVPRAYFIANDGARTPHSGKIEATELRTWMKQEAGS